MTGGMARWETSVAPAWPSGEGKGAGPRTARRTRLRTRDARRGWEAALARTPAEVEAANRGLPLTAA